MKLWMVVVLLLLIVLYATNTGKGRGVIVMGALTVLSPAFSQGELIPASYTCDGKNVNPPLSIGKIPTGTKSLALVMEDPDAPSGNWVHWVVWNIPPETREIPENSLPQAAEQGRNSWKRNSYGGPCPPTGAHRYFFRVFALDTLFQLAPASTKAELEQVMLGHILARGELMGTYRRK